MTFAAAIARANVAIFRHVADCTATVDNVLVSGAFRNGYLGALGGVVGTAEPSFAFNSVDFNRAKQGSALRIVDGPHAGHRYTVTSVEPDGYGVTLLRLQRVTAAA